MNNENNTPKKRAIGDLINTPFKKAMFAVQLISYILIVGSPLIGGVIGNYFSFTTAKIGGIIFGIFICGEILFYGSLFFLGKEIVMLVKDKFMKHFKKN